jgi:hypothetical protein
VNFYQWVEEKRERERERHEWERGRWGANSAKERRRREA